MPANQTPPPGVPLPVEPVPVVTADVGPNKKTSRGETILIAMSVVASLSIARPVLLPVFLACMIGMTLKPFISWLANHRIHRAFSAGILLLLVQAAAGVGFFELGRPAMQWVNAAPQHMTELRQRVQNIFPQIGNFSPAAAAVSNLGATEEEKRIEQRKSPTVELKENHGASASLTGPGPSSSAWVRRWCYPTCSWPRATCSCRSSSMPCRP